uniref:Transmembrane protein n=1 Tax=Chromera velia CCMP2878 TaxID=1169474 RepID=A0A0G4HRA4_9ALVE|eukprot:Cvel_1294.t1-p1 / transcript=Cvel_1294.t1 / gene=Cvel_1294 / organism=Chromera_velia_CCMP2878 / gene_product=hypothetical protein / transcript_product=hypothetical protein / location=Cvel_scaffold43:144699-146936(+) / protein_length=395 / sequence_SO=supercontig / SO=protein_coding / is_pseudo=false
MLSDSLMFIQDSIPPSSRGPHILLFDDHMPSAETEADGPSGSFSLAQESKRRAIALSGYPVPTISGDFSKDPLSDVEQSASGGFAQVQGEVPRPPGDSPPPPSTGSSSFSLSSSFPGLVNALQFTEREKQAQSQAAGKEMQAYEWVLIVIGCLVGLVLIIWFIYIIRGGLVHLHAQRESPHRQVTMYSARRRMSELVSGFFGFQYPPQNPNGAGGPNPYLVGKEEEQGGASSSAQKRGTFAAARGAHHNRSRDVLDRNSSTIWERENGDPNGKMSAYSPLKGALMGYSPDGSGQTSRLGSSDGSGEGGMASPTGSFLALDGPTPASRSPVLFPGPRGGGSADPAAAGVGLGKQTNGSRGSGRPDRFPADLSAIIEADNEGGSLNASGREKGRGRN